MYLNHGAVEAMVAETVERFGGLHMAVNNAGFTGPHNIKTADYEIEWWHRVIAANLSGIFFGMKYEIPAMIRSGGGAIVNMSSEKRCRWNTWYCSLRHCKTRHRWFDEGNSTGICQPRHPGERNSTRLC